jgi:hypothetical protein
LLNGFISVAGQNHFITLFLQLFLVQEPDALFIIYD